MPLQTTALSCPFPQPQSRTSFAGRRVLWEAMSNNFWLRSAVCSGCQLGRATTHDIGTRPARGLNVGSQAIKFAFTKRVGHGGENQSTCATEQPGSRVLQPDTSRDLVRTISRCDTWRSIQVGLELARNVSLAPRCSLLTRA